MILYPLFYRRNGIRRVDNLAKPALHSITTFEFPYDSIYHYVGEGMTDYGVSDSELIFKSYHKTMMVDHVIELTGDKGPPKHTMLPVASMIREYHRKNRRTRPLRNLLTTSKDKNTLIIVNYALLPHLYRYTRSIFANYNKWYNIESTLWDKLNAVATTTERQNYVFLKLPTVLPALSILTTAETHINRNVLSHIQEDSAFTLIDIWTWLGAHRETSLMHHLSHEALAKINLVFVESGRWFMVNLGMIDEWRKETPEEIAEDTATGVVHAHAAGTVLSANMIQRRFLRALMSLMEARTAGPSEATLAVFTEDTPESASTTDNTGLDEDHEIVTATDTGEDGEDKDPAGLVETKRMDEPHTDDDSALAIADREVPITSEEQERIDEVNRVADLSANHDLEELTRMSEKMSEKAQVSEYHSHEAKVVKPEDGVHDVADTMAELGLLSAAEYRRVHELATRYKSIPDPFGSNTTLAKAMEIKPSDTKIDESTPILDNIKGVSDASMLKSSLLQVDSKYIKEVLPKDILNAVVSVQAAGVAIQDYHIETVVDAGNAFQIHSVKLVPVVGKPTTARFRIPVVKEDGTFQVGNVKYIYRRQRSD